ncbi:uncharacterized protein [Antedon mediterranea]|uniref:uncharacterized protein n=1 Tax=Antedon mediterranea TaxID=105859 RepID=UPI003AF83FE8
MYIKTSFVFNFIETLKKGNFNIKKWQSNVRNMCDESEDATAATALGTKWDLVNDTLKVKEVKLIQGLIPTKRSILKQTASYYDVFGMLSGILVRPKTLLQKLWQLNIDWDTPLNQRSELCAILSEINKDLEKASDIELPRCLISEPFRGKRPLPKVSLHGASDASEDAMGIGVWLRWSHEESTEAYLSFVCARARLTPLKQSSIPRKELQAILLLLRLMLTVKNALRFDIVYSKIWTDSMTAISWLRGQSKFFRSYVAYRVGEITSEFDPIKDIAFVPSDQNTIDIVSRGENIDDMKQVIDGPGFLPSPPISWPKTPTNVQVAPEDGEQKKFHVRNAKTPKIKAIPEFERTLDPTKFSSWPKLKMVTARVVSLKQLPKNQWLKKLTSQISEWPSPHALKEAELLWVRQGQAEINFNDHNIMKLVPVFDEKEGVYRVGGRIKNAPLSRHKGKPIEQKMADLPDFRVKPCSPPFSSTLVDYLGPVNWKFGPPGGPHHQGAVERMVQEVKKGRRHLVKADRLTFVEWETVFCQISGLIK